MKIAPLCVIVVCLSALVGSWVWITKASVPGAGTPTKLAKQISDADHVVVKYQFVAHPPQLTNFSLSISGDGLKKIVGVVSSGKRHYFTKSFWGWNIQFYRGTNCLAAVPFSGDLFMVEGHGGGEYRDATGTLKQLYQDVLTQAHVDKNMWAYPKPVGTAHL